MFRRSVAVLTAAVMTADALSVPQDAGKITSNAEREECDIKLWVRADDLSPSTIVEGDVRLLNNMTTLSPATARGCEVLDWSLHLRYRERGAIQIPISDMQLPKKPSYNYSWDADSRGDRGFALNKMLSNGEDVSSFLVESQVNPHKAEIQEYCRQLDEYIRAVSSADKWIVREDEIVFFDSAMNMSNSPLEVVRGIQQATTSFGVAIPLVRFPEQSSKRTYWSNEDIAERILSTDETDMNYFAKVHLANGSFVEVMGGRTKFFEPGKAQVIKADVINLTLLQQDRRNCFPVYSAVDGSEMLDSKCSRRKDALSQQKLSATIEAPSRLVRGSHYPIKGQISSKEFTPTRIWIDIHTQRKKKWAHEQIESSGSVWTSFNIEDYSSALSLKRRLHDDGGREEENGGVFAQRVKKSHHRQASSGLTIDPKSGSFQMEYVPGDDLFGLGSTYFAEHSAEYVVKVEAKRIESKESPLEIDEDNGKIAQEQDAHQKLLDDLAGWSETDRNVIEFGSSSCQSRIPDKKQAATMFEARIPITGFSNEMVLLEKRDDDLRDSLNRQAAECSSSASPLHYLEEGALAPIFVDLSSESKIKEAISLVDPCAPPSPKFPAVNTKPVTVQHIPASLTNHSLEQDSTAQKQERVKYRKTKYTQDGRRTKKECWQIPGYCGGARQDVGKVWVNKVMLPQLKSKVIKEARVKESFQHDEALPFLVQV